LFLYSLFYFTIAGALLYFIVLDQGDFITLSMLYAAMFIQGFGMANMMNTSTSLVSEMIGHDDQSSAIVYASFNIIESFSNGSVVYIIMAFNIYMDDWYLKFLISVIPIICSIVAYLISYIRFKNRME
jgi:MFS family permease